MDVGSFVHDDMALKSTRKRADVLLNRVHDNQEAEKVQQNDQLP